jgi:hypothetical protein
MESHVFPQRDSVHGLLDFIANEKVINLGF